MCFREILDVGLNLTRFRPLKGFMGMKSIEIEVKKSEV